MVSIKKILDVNRNPILAEHVPHAYVDKYILANFVGRMCVASNVAVLEAMGLTPEGLAKLQEWNKNKAVTLELSSVDKCTFVKETKRDVESATKHVTEVSVGLLNMKKTNKTVTTITEYFWNYEVDWTLFAYSGINRTDRVTLASRKGSHELKTSSKSNPKREIASTTHATLNMTWLLSQINQNGQACFEIDRSDEKRCRTPRRNQQTYACIHYLRNLTATMNNIASFFRGRNVEGNKHFKTASDMFVPIVPLMEEGQGGGGGGDDEKKDDTPVIVKDTNKFLEGQKNSFNQKFAEIAKILPAPSTSGIITSLEGQLVAMSAYAVGLAQYTSDSFEYVEHMLRQQLIQAIGKTIDQTDFAAYMKFHNTKLFKPTYAPLPFCFAIRRPEHYPEGTISIEAEGTGEDLADPLRTCVRKIPNATPMTFSLNAATEVRILGDRYVHSCVIQQFAGSSTTRLSLNARARQFSSFIMMVGTVSSATKFEPKHAIIIKDKDDLKIPLILETIPTPKEFKDAIESLSPEQQRFCKAYRGMQLASTLFAVCVIQIKPQLEKLLNLPDDALTKEIKLTQDLMQLFIKYQIPSDLISYDGDPLAQVGDKVKQVQTHVKKMQEMINESKEEQLVEKVHETAYQAMDRGLIQPQFAVTSSMEFSAPPPPPAMAMAMAAPPMAMMKRSAAPAPRSMQKSAARPAAPAPAPRPQQQQQQQQAPKQPIQNEEVKVSLQVQGGDVVPAGAVDFTALPGKLDAAFLALDTDSALRSTIIKTQMGWKHRYQKSLLTGMKTKTITKDGAKDERNKAFDLLDALSRSGVLAFDRAELHVVLAATHCFEKNLIETVIQDNVNPIEKMERSTLIMASTVQDCLAVELVSDAQLERVKKYSANLFIEDKSQSDDN